MYSSASNWVRVSYADITDDELNLLEGDFFEIPLEGPVNLEPTEKIVPEPGDLSAVKSQIYRLHIEDTTACGMALLVAACFLNPGSRGQQEDERMLTYIDMCRQWMDWDDAATDHAELESSFLKCLYNYQSGGNIQGVVELPNVESKMEDIQHNCIFYDYRHLHMSDVFFHRVVKPLLKMASPLKIKKALAESGMLKSDNAGYTIKMHYCTAYGQSKSVRMLRFWKEKVVLPGEIRFIDLCVGGSENDED